MITYKKQADMSTCCEKNENQGDNSKELIKAQILRALTHPEAEDGLYFRNLYNLHEVDERLPVSGSKDEIMEALEELVREGKVHMTTSGDETVYCLTDA
ncbi:MAG: hypothetical protein D6808_04460 [Candidatus Dadabacteria bacterium]|nr:MAG: hypothetical protein D6808_04460 [Candidatus Dadabacteria bacterium]